MGSAPRQSSDPDARPSMSDTPPKHLADEPEQESSANGAGRLDELRQLIIGPEQEVLERLHNRVANPESRTNDVSEVVAESIHRRRELGGDEALSSALAPTIETALRESVRKDPATLADALFPVMGPAIRRSILETLRSFLESFNQILDQSLSWQGMKWRVEALRTGRSFTEVALLHNLVFRVEQVFLIHKKSGLPLGHVVAPTVAMEDPSLVSGMLSAIQDFVRDSFHAEQGQGINRLEVGELEVWIEDGPYAIVAAVIRGVPPRILRDRMAEALEEVHRQYSELLGRFDGDTAPFAGVPKMLSRCLESKFKEAPRRLGYTYAWAAAALLLVIVGGFFGWRWWQYRRWDNLVHTLRDQPGLVITSFGRENGRLVIRGLRDPLAADPQEFVHAAQLNPSRADFHWGAYYALDDAIVQQRAVALLSPPNGVRLTVTEGVLRVAGEPTAKWMSDLRARVLFVPGVRAVDVSSRFSAERLAFNELKDQVQSQLVMFPLASAALSASQRDALRELALKLKILLDSAKSLRLKVELAVVGHSDTTGAESTNQDLSQRRADRVAWELIQLGIPDNTFRAKGVASADPVRPEDSETNREFNRSVTFRISSTSVP
jgi:outer membrane protein OmpA-like peptidoglycan-associated protein